MRSLKESILSSNNANGIPVQILTIFRAIDTQSRLTELKKLWEEYDLDMPECFWSRVPIGGGYDYNDESDYPEKRLLSIRKGKHIYIRKNIIKSEYREKLIKSFGLKPIKLKNTNEKSFETYEF